MTPDTRYYPPITIRPHTQVDLDNLAVIEADLQRAGAHLGYLSMADIIWYGLDIAVQHIRTFQMLDAIEVNDIAGGLEAGGLPREWQPFLTASPGPLREAERQAKR